MPRFTRIQVASLVEEQGLIPIFNHTDLTVCKNILRACYQGGARVVEFTNRGEQGHAIFAELVKMATKELPDLVLAAGSITDGSTASLFIQSGTDFIVSPVLRKDIAIICNRHKILWSPGCGSLTEIARAEELGAEIIKLFPANHYGPGFIKAVKGPCPWTNIMPTGGVTTEKRALETWFDAGATCVGIGSQLIDESLVQEGKFNVIKSDVRDTLALIRQIRLE